MSSSRHLTLPDLSVVALLCTLNASNNLQMSTQYLAPRCLTSTTWLQNK